MASAAMSDAELVHAARDGDASALGALLERHRASLYASALAVLRDPAEAHDAVQDAFVVALTRLHQLREPAAAVGWLHAIVRTQCLMRTRRRQSVLAATIDQHQVGYLHVEPAVDQLALRDWVWAALGRLPADQSVAIMLRHFSRHRSYNEIAEALGVPVGTVRSRLNDARRRLADALLSTAASAHDDHAALVAERSRWWDAAVDELHRDGVARVYSAECAPDVLVEEPSSGYRAIGIDDHRRGVEDSVAAGVHMHTRAVWASGSVTIVEGDYENPPDDPHHCPATHTEVRIHRTGRTSRVILYYPTTAASRPC